MIREAVPPELLAVIDVGSSALRMAIGEAAAEGRPRRLETLEAPVAIGLDTLSRGRVQAVTTEAVVRTFQDFLTSMRGYGMTGPPHRVVATTAVRTARNRDVFLDRVEQATGLRIEVIEAVEEMQLLHQYVRRDLGHLFDRGVCMVLSLGSGGTQIVLQKGEELLFEETLSFGLLRLEELASEESRAMPAARAFLGKVVHAIERVQDLSGVTDLVVMNRELYELLHALLGKAAEPGATLRAARARLSKLRGAAERQSAEELTEGTELDVVTAERGRLALEELWAFASPTRARHITVPSASMLDCLLLDASLHSQGEGSGRTRARLVESAARAVGRKLHFDEPHGDHVRRLALGLFDQLRSLTHLSDRARLLLSVAALLHDVGYFVSPRRHEEHSAYLIEAGDIMGLRRDEVRRVALCVRLHRRPFRSLATGALDHLTADTRVEVLKLGALLRLAEALDQDHSQRVAKLELRRTGDTLRVVTHTLAGDREGFEIVARAFREKADLFAEVFGIEPTVTEVLAR